MIYIFEFENEHTYCCKSIGNKYKFSSEQSFVGFRASGSHSPPVLPVRKNCRLETNVRLKMAATIWRHFGFLPGYNENVTEQNATEI